MGVVLERRHDLLDPGDQICVPGRVWVRSPFPPLVTITEELVKRPSGGRKIHKLIA
jgi:hypothetical protein